MEKAEIYGVINYPEETGKQQKTFLFDLKNGLFEFDGRRYNRDEEDHFFDKSIDIENIKGFIEKDVKDDKRFKHIFEYIKNDLYPKKVLTLTKIKWFLFDL